MSKKREFGDGTVVELDDSEELTPEQAAEYEAEGTGCDYLQFEEEPNG